MSVHVPALFVNLVYLCNSCMWQICIYRISKEIMKLCAWTHSNYAYLLQCLNILNILNILKILTCIINAVFLFYISSKIYTLSLAYKTRLMSVFPYTATSKRNPSFSLIQCWLDLMVLILILTCSLFPGCTAYSHELFECRNSVKLNLIRRGWKG